MTSFGWKRKFTPAKSSQGFYFSIKIPIHPSIYLFILHLSIIYLYIHPSLYSSIFIFIHLYIHPSLYSSIFIFIHLSTHLSINFYFQPKLFKKTSKQKIKNQIQLLIGLLKQRNKKLPLQKIIRLDVTGRQIDRLLGKKKIS